MRQNCAASRGGRSDGRRTGSSSAAAAAASLEEAEEEKREEEEEENEEEEEQERRSHSDGERRRPAATLCKQCCRAERYGACDALQLKPAFSFFFFFSFFLLSLPQETRTPVPHTLIPSCCGITVLGFYTACMGCVQYMQ